MTTNAYPATLPAPAAAASTTSVTVWRDAACWPRIDLWNASLPAELRANPTYDARWLKALQVGLGHRPIVIEYAEGQRLRGLLPLAFVSSLLFGRHLVGLPYLNSGGVWGETPEIQQALIQRAVQLAAEFQVRQLQLRHEQPVESSLLGGQLTSKVHMRLELPVEEDQLWKRLSPKVRNQIRKAEKQNFTTVVGAHELLDGFYDVFSRNMRDLGTPVFSRRLFAAILNEFPADAELCVVSQGPQAVAAGLLVHGAGMSQVLSASSLRSFNPLCPNMLLYWKMLTRSIERQQRTFDFGRSTIDSNTYRFKEQWGARPTPAHWQFHLRQGDINDLRPDNPKFSLATRIWRKLPLPLTRWLGPSIIRGIP